MQDLAVGYGGSSSRYSEEKRVVQAKDIGPLISTEEMTRCIHCTRCVRFGAEIGGDMELGMINRGEHSEITTIKGDSVDSELSGNMIDICPVGALTSKPFRYSARTWELSRRKSISPHDSTGANLIVQVKNHKVMRVVPLENEAVNECWIADRDRFSYEALNGPDRLTRPMLKQGGQWQEVDWQTALEYVANGIKSVREKHGADAVGALVSPHSTLEELFLASRLIRGLGSDSIDYRLRHAEFTPFEGVRWLGTSIASLSTLQSVLVFGSNLRKDHPLFAQRIRQAARHGCAVHAVNSVAYDWAMPVTTSVVVPASGWMRMLAQIAAAVAEVKAIELPQDIAETVGEPARAIAASLLAGERKAILLGNGAAHHAQASSILALVQWIATHTGATFGYLSEAANTVGAQFVGAQPLGKGFNAAEMLAGKVKAALLLNTEPTLDSVAGVRATLDLSAVDMVVTLSPFKTNLEFSDVLLPIAPFTETAGTFVNAEGRVQSFHAVVKPLGETRPAWKVLRVLGNLLEIPDMEWETAQDVLSTVLGQENLQNSHLPVHSLHNETSVPIHAQAHECAEPVVAAIYQLDSLVRRSPALQKTVDAHVLSQGAAA